jgi:hypothetical protein
MEKPRRSSFLDPRTGQVDENYVQVDEDLNNAAIEFDVEGTRRALDAGANPNRFVLGGVPFLEMVLHSNLQGDPRIIEIVRILLEHGANPEIRNTLGQALSQVIDQDILTGYVIAYYPQNLPLLQEIKKLLEAAKEKKMASGMERLRRSKFYINLSTGEFDENYVQIDEDLAEAIYKCDVNGVRSALDGGANPNRFLIFHTSLLSIIAGRYGTLCPNPDLRIEIMKFLLAHNADPEILDRDGMTPLDLIRTFQPEPKDVVVLKQLEELLEAAIKIKIQRKRAQNIIGELLQQEPMTSYLRLLRRELAAHVAQLASIDPQITAEVIGDEQLTIGRAIQNGASFYVQMLLEQGVSPEIVRVGTNVVPGLWMATTLNDPQEALEMVRLIISHIRELNPLYRGKRLLDILRELPNRQSVIALIEQVMRERQHLAPIAPEVQGGGWLGSLFSWGKSFRAIKF